MTEQAYFHSVAQEEAFRELGVEEYEILATLDSHTSAICRSLDGKVFPMKEYAPVQLHRRFILGAEPLPFHTLMIIMVVKGLQGMKMVTHIMFLIL